jgi:hypothetical protein
VIIPVRRLTDVISLQNFRTCLILLSLCGVAALHARNPRLAFTSGGVFDTGADPAAILAAPRDTNAKSSVHDLFISSYRDSSVIRAGRSDAGFVAPLRGVLWDNKNFSGKQKALRGDAIDFDWGNDAPLPGFGADTFSARWTGEFRVARSGLYRFTTESDDGVRLWIGDKKIVDRWHDMAPAFHSGEIELKGGRSYKLRMDYYENGGGAVARLFWRPPGAAKRTLMRGLGGFAPQSEHSAGLGARAMATADLNGDGRPDLAVANYNFAGDVTLLLSNAAGGFDLQSVSAVGDDPIDLALADLNGDARPELIVLNRSSADLRIYAHRPEQASAPESASPADGVSYSRNASVRVALPAGSGPATQLGVADLNGDRRPDLLILAGDLFYLSNAGAGDKTNGPLVQAFGAAPRPLIEDPEFARDRRERRATSFAAADLDRDGDTDIAVAFTDDEGRRSYITCLRNTGPAKDRAAGAPAFIWAGSLSTLPVPGQQTIDPDDSAAALEQRGVSVVRARDLDGDGLADLVINHPALPGLSIYRNNSRTGKLLPDALRAQKFPKLSAPATDLRLADLNGDGKIDVAALHGTVSRASVYFAR